MAEVLERGVPVPAGAVRMVQGGVCAPRGFLAAGIHCGIKKSRRDLALIVSREPARAAAVFTRNRVQAAPLHVTREHLAGGILEAVIVNSGNANACLGKQGIEDAREMARLTAAALGIPMSHVAVASTGVIGVPLPMDAVRAGIPRVAARLSRHGGRSAARAIMTTDTFPKEAAVSLEVGGREVTVGGMAKGSGMIHPDLATMLAFLTTDAVVHPAALDRALRESVDVSFNMISVDGDTSTNDMVLFMGNGEAGNSEIREGTPEFLAFREALSSVTIALARAIVRDGEGATKLITVVVRGAASTEDARKAALAICRSNLVKAAIFGQDANWGRILAALGYSGARFDEEKISLALGAVPVVREGCGLPFDEDAAREALAGPDVLVTLGLGDGPGEATAWGCDLTYEYVRINGSYRS